MEELHLGYCPIDDTQIWTMEPGKNTPNEDYEEFWLAQSDNFISRHAVCKKCYSTLTTEQVLDLFEKIKRHWQRELVGSGTQEEIDRVSNISVISWGLRQEDLGANVIEKGDN